MTNTLPNFFANRTEPCRFADVIAFIRSNFDIRGPFAFRVGKKDNTADENQDAGLVFAYAQCMHYTFNQVKALFSEHDHFAIAMPETRQGRNVLELNAIFADLLYKGYSVDVRINNFPELFDVPKDVLSVQNNG